MNRLILLVVSLTAVGCTDARWDAEFGSLGESHQVDCFSGGQKIFEAKTSGKVAVLEGGGWAFRTTDGRFVQTFADCFVWFNR